MDELIREAGDKGRDVAGEYANPRGVERADLIVALPSRREADYIAHTAATAAEGLRRYFPDRRVALVNADNDSDDGTREAFLNAPGDAPKVYISTPAEVTGKGANVRNIFRVAVALQAQAVVMVDADLTSINPRWIQFLGEPLLAGYDYVTPIYVRHKYDASVTNLLAYPMLRTLFGLRLRQPIGGDFGFSGRLARAYLEEPYWGEAAAGYGIDLFMTTVALARGFKVCQAFLGAPKSHRVKDPARDLDDMFGQVVTVLFDLMGLFADQWLPVVPSGPTAIFGFGLGVDEKPTAAKLDTGALWRGFREGAERWATVWKSVLPPDLHGFLSRARAGTGAGFRYETAAWARLLFHFAVAYHLNVRPREEIVQSMIPLYHSLQLSFVNQTETLSLKETEERFEDMMKDFEAEKPGLVQIWRAAVAGFGSFALAG